MSKHVWRDGLTALAALCLAGAAPAALASNGTQLSIAADNDTPVCSGNNCTVNITTAATTTGSTSPASILVSTDGGVSFTQIGTVQTTDWVGSGRTKSVEEDFPIDNLAAGTSYDVTVCYIQPGANGNPLKKACADLTITTPSNCVGTCAGAGSPGL